MKLYTYWRSSCSWRVRIVLHFKQLPFDSVPIHLVRDGGQQHSARYGEINAMAQVPTLVLDDGTAITQSVAIMEYLEEVYPQPPLLPAQPPLRARVREITEVINAGIQPLHNLAVLQEVQAQGGDKQAWAAKWISKGLDALERYGQKSGGAYMVEDRVTWADVCLVPQIAAARRFMNDLSAYPTLLRIEKQLHDLPAFMAAHAQRQPDAEAST